MYKITLKVEGMHCGMCESCVNDAVRAAGEVKKVKSSARLGNTVIITPVPGAEIFSEAITKKGYKVSGATVEPYAKKGFFGRA